MMDCATSARPAPFPGLRPFQRQEASLFFGRSREVAELRNALLGERRFLAVVGTSGCGKSSLVEAGLLPRLLGEQRPGGRLWSVISLRPLGGPVAQLAASLATFAQAQQPDSFGGLHASMLASRFRATLRRTTRGLVGAAREILTDPAAPVLVVVDQFEELFRYEPDETDAELPLFRDEAQAFANLLLEAARASETNIYVLITMRSDFFGECGRYRGLAEAVSGSQFLVPRMVREQLQEAITRPLCVAAGIPADRWLDRWPEVVEPALLQRLLNAVGDEATADPLPVMQHALMRAWQMAEKAQDQRERPTPQLRVVDYVNAGEIAEALSRHADEVLKRSVEAAGEALPRDGVAHLFRALTDIDREGRAIRRPQTLAELAPVVGSDIPTLMTVLDAFRGPGVSFLTPYMPTPIDEATPIDISHEALIRRWTRISDQSVDPATGLPRGWVQQEFRDGLIWRALVVQAEEFGRNPQACLDPATLGQRYPWFRALRRRPAWALRYAIRPARRTEPDAAPEWLEVRQLLLQSLRRKRDGWRARQAEAKATYAKRLRFVKWGAAGVAVVIGFLFLWMYRLGLQEAAHRRQIHAVELAEAAQNVPDPELGTLLAIEAMRAADWTEGSVPENPTKLLQDAINTPRADKQLSGLGGAPHAIFFKPDGTQLVATSLGNATLVQDPASRMRIGTWRPTTVVWDAVSGSPVFKIISETPVSALALSPDGQWLATASWDGAVQVFDPASGKKISTVAHNKVVNAAFSLDGQRIATVGIDGSAKVSDVGSGEPLFSVDSEVNKNAAVAHSPDLKWLAIASRDQNDQTVTVLAADGSEVFKKPVPGPSIALTFNSNNNRLANLSNAPSGIDNFTVWEVPSGNPLTPSGRYSAAAFSPDGNLLAGASQDGSIHLWNIAAGIRPLRTFSGHTAQVSQVVFDPDSLKIAAASVDGMFSIWDIRSGKQLLSVRGAEGRVVALVFRPGSAQIAVASGDGTVSLWNIDSPHAGAILAIAFSRDGHRLVTSSADGTIKIWNADTRRVLSTVEGSELRDVYALVFNAEGSRLFAASSEGQLTVWDVTDPKTPTRQDSFSVDLKNGVTLTLSVDGKSLVTAGGEGAAKVWDLAKHLSRPFGGPDRAQAVALSEDGRHLATVNPDKDEVDIWDDGMTKDLWSIKGTGLDAGKDVKFSDVALSPDGRYLMSRSEEGLILLWDVRSKERHSLPSDFLKYADVRSGLAFSSDGDHLATANAKNVVVWDIANSGVKYIHAEGITTLAFSRDGKRLATAGGDGTVQVWSLAADDLIARAQTLTTRALTRDECNLYHVEPCLPPRSPEKQ
jgi:WD40 repeat protein